MSTPVRYIDKSTNFYAAHGYDRPYQWANNDTAPLTSPGFSLTEARVAVVTTSFPITSAPSAKQVYAQASEPQPPAMFTQDLSWDKEATHTNDVGSFLPLDTLAGLAAEGVIGSLAPRFYGVPTEYSQRRTHADAETIAGWAAEDEVDLVLLVPL